jgi:hypothetical protein
VQQGNDESTDVDGYINMLLMYSLAIFFPETFHLPRRPVDESTNAVVLSGDRTGAAPVDAVQTRVVEEGPGGV